MVAGGENLLDASLLLVAQRLVRVEFQQLAETEDGVHRGPQLVAHAGEEVRLGMVRGVGPLHGEAQLLLGLLEHRDIHEDADPAPFLCRIDGRTQPAAVGQFVLHDFVRGAELGHLPRHESLDAAGGFHVAAAFGLLAHDLRERDTGNKLPQTHPGKQPVVFVDENQAAVGAVQDEAVVDALDGVLQQCPGGRRPVLRTVPLGHLEPESPGAVADRPLQVVVGLLQFGFHLPAMQNDRQGQRHGGGERILGLGAPVSLGDVQVQHPENPPVVLDGHTVVPVVVHAGVTDVVAVVDAIGVDGLAALGRPSAQAAAERHPGALPPQGGGETAFRPEDQFVPVLVDEEDSAPRFDGERVAGNHEGEGPVQELVEGKRFQRGAEDGGQDLQVPGMVAALRSSAVDVGSDVFTVESGVDFNTHR